MSEQWRDIASFEGRYQVSSRGRVRSLDRTLTPPCGQVRRYKGQLLKPAPHTSGHLMVMLGRKNNRDVHVLVAEAFHGPRPHNCEVLHLNHKPADNRVENLKWGTRSENIKMDYKAGRRKMPRLNFNRWGYVYD